MFNHIKADIYRITQKKSFYIMMILFTVIFSGFSFGFRNESSAFQEMISMLASSSPVLIGIFVLSAVYSDDLKSYSIQTAIGFGTKRSQIVLTKFIESVLLLLFFFAYTLVHLGLAILIFNYKFDAGFLQRLMGNIISTFIGILACYAVSSIFIFTVQKATVAIVIYLLLTFGMIDQLVGLLLQFNFITKIFGDLQPYLLSNATYEVYYNMALNQAYLVPLMTLFAYIILGLGISSLLFNKVELEF